MSYLLLIIGFVLLIKGADFFVEGASNLAERLKVPPLVIGLTIVAFGTSAPEAAVSITSALNGQNAIAIGNIVGSNLFNLLFVVGIAAFIYPLQVKRSIITKEFPFAILSSFMLLILAQDQLFQQMPNNLLTRADGVVLLVLFGIYMYYLIDIAMNHRRSVLESERYEEEQQEMHKEMGLTKQILIAIGGMIGIIIGGKLVVDGATDIALAWGMSENLVGLTIVAIGTSLPELITSIVAATKEKSDIALGNVIGSNIFNVFFILGLSATISPMAVQGEVLVDMVILLVVSLLAYLFAITKTKINKVEGSLLVLLYAIYMVYIIGR
ncbi:sodium:proton exchanger [Sporanaerobium hydrogeniformans]|uniref:Sodium:proton exchanger n=1 Tax=Sporanaerobium hydrogeniformans TaxID=3072179 RepID=A0AC61DEQ5_9FIRM|nr:calcium/sodium antiporter [Sporanaerobium hydrogeniformans]PHV71789.1 sodium:proton exchanger [Sporanaerobium hydrogeniformans]